MNKLLNPNGGMPLELDDLMFMQEATRDAFKGIIYEIAKEKNGNIILGGCVTTGSSAPYNVSEGYVMLDYEVYYVPAHTSNFAFNSFVQATIAYDPNGSDTFFDGVTRDTYEVRQATSYVSGSFPSIIVADQTENRLIGIIKDKIFNTSLIEEIVQTDAEGVRYDFVVGDMAADVSINATSPPYAIKKNGRVALYGTIILDASIQGVAGTSLLTLPLILRPTSNTLFNLSRQYLVSNNDHIEVVSVTLTELIMEERIVTGSSGSGLLKLAGIIYDIET